MEKRAGARRMWNQNESSSGSIQQRKSKPAPFKNRRVRHPQKIGVHFGAVKGRPSSLTEVQYGAEGHDTDKSLLDRDKGEAGTRMDLAELSIAKQGRRGRVGV